MNEKAHKDANEGERGRVRSDRPLDILLPAREAEMRSSPAGQHSEKRAVPLRLLGRWLTSAVVLCSTRSRVVGIAMVVPHPSNATRWGEFPRSHDGSAVEVLGEDGDRVGRLLRRRINRNEGQRAHHNITWGIVWAIVLVLSGPTRTHGQQE